MVSAGSVYTISLQYSQSDRNWNAFFKSLSGGSDGCNAGGPDSIPGLERSPGEGNDNPLQYSCLENLMDRGAWWAIIQGVMKSQTRLNPTKYLTESN